MDTSILSEILIDQQRLLGEDEDLIPRDIDLEKAARSKEIIVISGIRRCGKSSLLRLISRRDDRSKVFVDFSDIRFSSFDIDDYRKLDKCILELFGEVDLYLLDEVQNVPMWQRWVNGIHSRGKKVFVTGSNSNLLSSEISTYLTGRNRVISLSTFSFNEYLRYKGKSVKDPDHIGTKEKVGLLKLFNEFSISGGFPEVVGQSDVSLARYYFDDIITRDIVARFGIREVGQLKELALFLVSNAGSPLSYKKLKAYTGIKSLSTIKSYMDHLEESYLFSRVKRFSYSLKKQQAYPSKLYAGDVGFITSTAFRFSDDSGHRLENSVYNHLKGSGCDVYYHFSRKECDFILKEGKGITCAIQVCENFSKGMTRDREIEGLLDALEEYGLVSGTIITRDHEEEITMDDRTINVVPAWKWFLKLEISSGS